MNNDKAVIILSLNEINKRNSFLKKNKKTNFEILSEIKNQFDIYTIFFTCKKLTFVLDYINDKEAIINQFSEINKFELQFFDKSDFHKEILEDDKILKDHIILYSYEKYFELLGEIDEKLFRNHSNIYVKVNPR